jgi:hypothetical protein
MLEYATRTAATAGACIKFSASRLTVVLLSFNDETS